MNDLEWKDAAPITIERALEALREMIAELGDLVGIDHKVIHGVGSRSGEMLELTEADLLLLIEAARR